MAEQVRVQLMLEWMEKNPKAVQRVQDQLKNLHMTYMRSAKGLRQMGMDEARLTRALEIAREQYQKEQTGIVDVAHSREFTTNVLKRLTKEEEKHTALMAKQGLNLKRFGRQMTRVGYKMGWMGFRMTIMGRMMMRWIQKPIQDTIKLMVGWEKAIETTAEAMGMLAYTGELTGERQDFLMDTIMGLLEVGPKFQAMWLYLQSAMASILVSVAEPMIDFIEVLADALIEAGPEIADVIVPALESLADTFEELLPDIMELALEALPPFVKGLEDAAGFMVSLFDKMGPILPYFAELLGYVIGISPLLIAIGTALYALSPALIAAGAAVDAASWLWQRLHSDASLAASGVDKAQTSLDAFSGSAGTAGVAISDLILPFAGLAAVLVLVEHYKKDIADWSRETFGIERTEESMTDMVDKLYDTTHAFGEFDAVDKDFRQAVGGDMIQAINDAGKAIQDFGGWIWGLFGGSPIPDLIMWLGKAEEAVGSLKGEMAGLDIGNIEGGMVIGRAGYTGPSEVIVYVTQYITGGAGMDEDELADQVANAASRGMGRAFRRRFK